MGNAKPIQFRGSSLDDLRNFPALARRNAGFQLDAVQHGQEPDDWKPMPTFGQGINEIRIRDASGAYRVIYVATFSDVIYVLHCFTENQQAGHGVGENRYRELLKELGK